jgi:hypothetical protein
MSDSSRFVEATYTHEQIREFPFPAKGSHSLRTAGMLFRYSRDPETSAGYFDEVVEAENPLVDSMVAQRAVEDLRSKGLTFREISRLAGVSVEAVHRSSGRARLSKVRAGGEAVACALPE